MNNSSLPPSLGTVVMFTGQVSTKPERRDGRWYLSIWNTKSEKGINGISSQHFEVNHKNVPFELKPGDEVEVSGEVLGPGTFLFDDARLKAT